jgi:hypothetical protein
MLGAIENGETDGVLGIANLKDLSNNNKVFQTREN